METSDIDELLHRFTHAESRIAANLVEFDDHPTYALLASGALVGTTAARLDGLVDAAPGMWQRLDALRRTLDRARALRAARRLGDDERLELEAILTRASVLVEVTETPLAERDLLADGVVERHVSIEELIEEIRERYEPLRDVVADIDARWRELLPRLDAAERTLAHLAGELRALDVPEPTVSMANGRVRELRRLVMDDPLAIDPGAGAELDALVGDAARRVGSLRRAHDELAEDLTRTESLVAELRVLHRRAATAHAEAVAKVRDPEALVRVPSAVVVDDLARRAAALRRDDRPWAQRRGELDAWLQVATRLHAQLARAEERNIGPLRRRDELRGLLAAYRAKAAALGLIEQLQLSEIVAEAHNELYTAPVDLNRGARLVQRLGALIRERVAAGTA